LQLSLVLTDDYNKKKGGSPEMIDEKSGGQFHKCPAKILIHLVPAEYVEQNRLASVKNVWGMWRMPAGLTSKERPRTAVPQVRRQNRHADLQKNIALFLFGAAMTLFAFWLYGGHSCTADIIRESSPHHVYHQNYYESGTS